MSRDGPKTFAESVQSIIRRKYNEVFTDAYFSLRGSRNVRVGGYSAEFNVDGRSDSAILRYLIDEETEQIRHLLEELRDDDILFDIGANIGVYTCIAGDKLEEGKVVAFEPYQPNVRRCQENIEKNNVNAEVVERVLSNSKDTVEFDLPRSDSSMGRASIASSNMDKETISVDTIPLDNCIDSEDINFPNIVKIDVEGAEQLVLEGMEDMLSTPELRTIFVEVHLPDRGLNAVTDYGGSVDNVKQLLHESGFQIEILRRQEATEHLKATRTEESGEL